MPELAAVHSIGIVMVLLQGAIWYWLTKTRSNSPAAIQIQMNLQTVGKYWSDREGEIKTGSGEDLLADHARALKAFLTMLFFCALIGWIGFLVLMVIGLSMQTVGRSRFERRLFASPIALRELTPVEIQEEILKLTS